MPEYTHKVSGMKCRIICTDRVTDNYNTTIVLLHPSETGCGARESTCFANPADLTPISPYDDWPHEARIVVWNGNPCDVPLTRFRRRFAGVDKDGRPLAYANGADKWGSNGDTLAWDHAELCDDDEFSSTE